MFFFPTAEIRVAAFCTGHFASPPPCDTSIIYVAGAMLVVGSVAGQLIAHDTHAPNLQAELFYEQVMQKMLHVVELKPQSETNDP